MCWHPPPDAAGIPAVPALANFSAVAIHPAVAVILALDVVFKYKTL
jgi:hypothetical protein